MRRAQHDQDILLPALLNAAYRSISLAWREKFPHAHIPGVRMMAQQAEARSIYSANDRRRSNAAAATSAAEVPLPRSIGISQAEAAAVAGAPGASSGPSSQGVPNQDVLEAGMVAAPAADPHPQRRTGIDDGSLSLPRHTSGEGAEQQPDLAAGSKKRSAEGEAEAPDQDRRKRHSAQGAALPIAEVLPAQRAGSIGSMVNSLEQQVLLAQASSCTCPSFIWVAGQPPVSTADAFSGLFSDQHKHGAGTSTDQDIIVGR